MQNTFKEKPFILIFLSMQSLLYMKFLSKLIAIIIYCRLIQLQIAPEIFAVDRNINLLLAIVLWITELFHKLWLLRVILFFLVYSATLRTSCNFFHSLCFLKLRYLAGLSQFKYLVVIYLLVDLLIYLLISPFVEHQLCVRHIARMLFI